MLCFSEGSTPSFQHEYLRRKLETGVREFWNYLSSQLQDLKSASQKGQNDIESRVDNMLAFGADHLRYSVH